MVRRFWWCLVAGLCLAACGGEDDGATGDVPPASVAPAAGAPAPGPVPGALPGDPTLPPGPSDPALPADPALPPGPALPPEGPAAGELAMDECGLDTGWPGDEFCILPPPPDQGFQVHVGPSSYASPEPRYVLQPGQETNEYFPAVSGNETDVYFYYRQYRMRSGSHHMIITESGGGIGGIEAGGGRRLGGSQNSAKDNPHLGVAAPENAGVGVPLSAKAPLSVNLHYINTGDEPVLQEAWVNFWYKDAAEVTEEAREMFLVGSVSFAISPGEDTILGPFSCTATGTGRVLSMYGHRHANTPRFSAWRTRNGVRELIYESLDWHEPSVFEFNSITENPQPNRDLNIDGAHNGILDIQPGDVFEWECHVINERDTTLRFTNETYDGEMCILIGDTVGTTVSCSPGAGGFGF